MLLKITTGTVSNKHNFPDDCTLGELQLFVEDRTGIADYEMEMLVGYPPTLIQHHSMPSDTPLSKLGIQSGMVISVRPNDQLRAMFHKLSELGFARPVIKQCFCIINTMELDLCVELCTQLTEYSHSKAPGPMIRKVIPADNSCLFNSIGFLVEQPNYDNNAMRYRTMVADYILAHRDDYPTHLLEGKDCDHYARWILNADKWGGEIEVSILSAILGIQIAVIDIRTGNTYAYGQEHGFSKVIYLLYDGVHYDALLRKSSHGVETIFNVDDSEALISAEEVAKDMKSKRLYVDLAKGQLQCGVCHAVLNGESEAVEHAKTTGHQNFHQS